MFILYGTPIHPSPRSVHVRRVGLYYFLALLSDFLCLLYEKHEDMLSFANLVSSSVYLCGYIVC